MFPLNPLYLGGAAVLALLGYMAVKHANDTSAAAADAGGATSVFIPVGGSGGGATASGSGSGSDSQTTMLSSLLAAQIAGSDAALKGHLNDNATTLWQSLPEIFAAHGISSAQGQTGTDANGNSYINYALQYFNPPTPIATGPTLGGGPISIMPIALIPPPPPTIVAPAYNPISYNPQQWNGPPDSGASGADGADGSDGSDGGDGGDGGGGDGGGDGGGGDGGGGDGGGGGE